MSSLAIASITSLAVVSSAPPGQEQTLCHRSLLCAGPSDLFRMHRQHKQTRAESKLITLTLTLTLELLVGGW